MSGGRERATSLSTRMPILRSKSSAARAGKRSTSRQPSTQKVQSESKSQKSSVSPKSGKKVRPLSKNSLKRSREPASPLGRIQPEQPVRKTKTRKALLNTLWTAEELIPLKAKTEQLYNQLNQLYVDPPCPLDYSTPFQLLVAVILSAQVGG